MTATATFIWFGIAATALVLSLFVLGTLIEWYQKHKFLAWILFIGLILSLFAYGFHVQNPIGK